MKEKLAVEVHFVIGGRTETDTNLIDLNAFSEVNEQNERQFLCLKRMEERTVERMSISDLDDISQDIDTNQ